MSVRSCQEKWSIRSAPVLHCATKSSFRMSGKPGVPVGLHQKLSDHVKLTSCFISSIRIRSLLSFQGAGPSGCDAGIDPGNMGGLVLASNAPMSSYIEVST